MKIAIKVKNIDTMLKNFKDAPKVSSREYSRALQSTGRFIQARAMQYAPVNKGKGGGNLRQSIKMERLGLFNVAIVANAKYAEYVDQGTRPHVIVPRTKPFLAFQINGRWVRTKRVNHPGTKPTYFFTTAAKDGEAYLNRAMDIAAKRVIDSI